RMTGAVILSERAERARSEGSALVIPSRPKVHGNRDQHANGTSLQSSTDESRVQDEVHRGLIEPRVGTLDYLHRRRLGSARRVDDGAHDHPSFNTRLTQQVGILQPWSRHYNRSLEPARSRDRLRCALCERQFVRLQIDIPDNAAHLDRHAVVPGGRPTVENDDVMATCVLVTADQARRVHCWYTAQVPQGDCDGACAVEGETHLRFSLRSHWQGRVARRNDRGGGDDQGCRRAKPTPTRESRRHTPYAD